MNATEDSKIPKVYAAIAEVMAELAKVGIGKNNKNTQQGYKFRGIDDVYNALAPLLARTKLLILPRVLNRVVTERETKNGGVLFYVVLDAEFDFVAAEDASKHTVRVVGEAMDSGDKATNKAMSAAYKYACMEAFCIPTEGDNDADASTHEVAPRRGVTIVDPRGDTAGTSDPAVVAKWTKKVADALASDNPVASIYAIHGELAPDDVLYIDVADAIAKDGICSKHKWKELVRAGSQLAKGKAA
jgi:hypothetical protein